MCNIYMHRVCVSVGARSTKTTMMVGHCLAQTAEATYKTSATINMSLPSRRLTNLCLERLRSGVTQEGQAGQLHRHVHRLTSLARSLHA